MVEGEQEADRGDVEDLGQDEEFGEVDGGAAAGLQVGDHRARHRQAEGRAGVGHVLCGHAAQFAVVADLLRHTGGQVSRPMILCHGCNLR